MLNKKLLDKLYEKYSKRELVFPDPVGFLYEHKEMKDREIAGLIASSLAYGRVNQINKSVDSVMVKMTPSPYKFITENKEKTITETFKGFKHRFTTDIELAALMISIKRCIEEHKSIENWLMKNITKTDTNVFKGLSKLSEFLINNSELTKNSLIPLPEKGSACKRQNLYLRWMVRKDNVDPGGWENIDKSILIMPIDTHIHKLSLKLKLTERKNADMRAAIEITESFKKLNPEDPIKYDFSLTKASMLKDEELLKLLN
ncbi:MAG: TIGR02757 family protein [Vampirovibrionia bacterium]